MSQENFEIVRRGFDAWERGDLEAFLSLIREDVICRRVPPLIDPREYEGLDGYLQFASEWTEPYEELRFRPSEFLDAGDRVLVEAPQEGRLAGSDQVMKGTFWFLLTVKDGKLTRFEIYGTRDPGRRSRRPAGVALLQRLRSKPRLCVCQVMPPKD